MSFFVAGSNRSKLVSGAYLFLYVACLFLLLLPATYNTYVYANLTLNNATLSFNNHVECTLSSITISLGGVLSCTDAKIFISSGWANYGSFNAGKSSVTFIAADAAATLRGNTTFYSFICETPNKWIYFAHGSTQTILNKFILTGAAGGNYIRLRSSIGGQKWYISFPNATQMVYYVDVKDSDALYNTVTCVNSFNSGNNNENWIFSDDFVPPGKVTGFVAATGIQVRLSWVAPGDDEYSGNVAGGMWQIVYSSNPAATPETAEYSITKSSSYTQGATCVETITGLKPRTTYYFWIRARDDVDTNWSVWSDTSSATAGSFVDIAADLPGVDRCSLSWGDYDNDGDLDLALAGDTGPTFITKIYRNDNGNFVDINAGLVGVAFCSLAWGDYDNDGDLDLALAGNTGSTRVSKIYRNDNGSFVDINAELPGVDYCSLAWGDYDNDGDLDLALVGHTGSERLSRIYRNDKGSFVDISAGLTGVSGGAVAWADFDNDGDLDIVVAGEGESASDYRVDFYENISYSFSLRQSISGVKHNDISIGDIDNDGDLDVILGLTGAVYKNNSFYFTLTQNLSSIGNSGFTSIGDFDNDGDMDIGYGGGSGFEYVNFEIFVNAGDGDYSSQQALPVFTYGRAEFADIDNDGDLDLCVAGEQHPGYVKNTRIYKSLEAEFNNTNTTPSAPSSGFISEYDPESATLRLRWDDGTDTETPQKGLYYNVRVATEPITDNLKKWVVSPSTGAGATPFLGNYPHGFAIAVSTQPGLNLKPPIEGVTYYWQVRTIDAGLRQSAWSLQQSTYVPNEPPTIPLLLAPINDAATQQLTVTFDWSDSIDTISGVSNYELQVSTDISFEVINYSSAPTISQATLTLSENKYYWRVRAKDNAGNYSDWASAYLLTVDTTSPVSVGFESLTAISSTTIISTGTATDVLSGLYSEPYYIQLSTDGITWGNYDSGWVVSSHTWTELNPNTTYWFRIKAKDAAGNESVWSSAVTKVTLANPPTDTYISDVSSWSITLHWSENNNPSYTRWGILRSTDNFETSTTTIKSYIDGFTETTYTDKDAEIQPATTYYYKVCAFNEEGIATAFDMTVSTVTLPPPDTVPPAVAITFPVDNAFYNSVLTISGTASDNVAVAAVKITIRDLVYPSTYWSGDSWCDSEVWLTAIVYTSSWEYTSVPSWSDGVSYRVVARAQDTSGNWSVQYATSTFTYDIAPPAAVTTLSAITGFGPGEISLSWVSPGDNFLSGELVDGKYLLRYSTYAEVDFLTPPPSEAHSEEWNDYQNKYELLWTTSTPPLVPQCKLLTGLRENVTYYIRLWTADKASNWAAISNGATSYAQETILSVSVDITAYNFGILEVGITTISVTSATVRNTGNVAATWQLRATTATANTPWQLSSSAGVDKFVLWGVFNSTLPSSETFSEEDKLSYSYQECSETVFAGDDQSGFSVTPGQERVFWWKLQMPLISNTTEEQKIRLEIMSSSSAP